MTPRQSELLAYLRERALAGDVSPSFEEMRAHLGVASKSRVHDLILALEQRGHITRDYNRNRSITVVGIDEYARGYRDGLAAAANSKAASAAEESPPCYGDGWAQSGYAPSGHTRQQSIGVANGSTNQMTPDWAPNSYRESRRVAE